MTKTKKIIYQSLFLGFMVTIFWGAYYMKFGTVPNGVFNFHFFEITISRWWDILSVISIIPICVWFSSFKKEDAYIEVFFLMMFVIAGVPFGFVNGLIFGMGAFILFFIVFIISNYETILEIVCMIVISFFLIIFWPRDAWDVWKECWAERNETGWL